MIDPNSENYQPYMAEGKKLIEWHKEEWRKLDLKYPYAGGRNIARERAGVSLQKELSRRLKELQIKYGYREKLP